MQWWCSSQTVAWDWTWRPYLGVWGLVAAIAVSYAFHVRTLGKLETSGLDRGGVRHMVFFASGLVCLWAALDWPLGPLGASYLASIHMVQFLLVALVAPPLLLLGLPAGTFQMLRSTSTLRHALESLTQPLVAFFIFNVVMTVSHWPSVVDTLMVSQLGSFAIDISWLVSGLIFWWPLISPVPERPRFSFLVQIAYLGFNAVLIRPPTVILLYSKFPAYATYELAPPIPGTAAMDDQQLAGVIMKVGSAWIMLLGMTILFILWHRASRREQNPAPS